MVRTSLTSDHHKQRIEQLYKVLEQKEINTYFVFNSHNIFYLTGFSFIPTELQRALRNFGWVLEMGDERVFMVLPEQIQIK